MLSSHGMSDYWPKDGSLSFLSSCIIIFFSNLFTALYIYLPARRLPMYNEAKLAFFIYLWYPKTMVLYFAWVLCIVSSSSFF